MEVFPGVAYVLVRLLAQDDVHGMHCLVVHFVCEYGVLLSRGQFAVLLHHLLDTDALSTELEVELLNHELLEAIFEGFWIDLHFEKWKPSDIVAIR